MKWQEIIKDNITTAEDLREPLKLSAQETDRISEEIAMFPMSVTRYYLSLINPDDPDDPIRKMAIPAGHVVFTDGQLDTSGEQSNTVFQGLQHKYRETVLVLTTADCAMFCRHCFRRRLVGKNTDEITANSDDVAAYIRSHPEVNNVLLSGGDSFMQPTEKISGWLEKLTAINHLDFIRFGTRTPVTFPQRILTDPDLLRVLAEYASKKQIYVITHFNHPREITSESSAAVRTLQHAGITVKNQTVLLRGVNDRPDTLAMLLRKISALGIVQHYIFQCRPVKGVKSRFQVPVAEGCDVVQAALAQQNGLGKSADYTMSHPSGKIRILGKSSDGQMVFQYKQAKDPTLIGRIFSLAVTDTQTWLPERIEPV